MWRVSEEVECERTSLFATHHTIEIEEYPPFDAGASHRLGHVPNNPCPSGKLQHRAVPEIHEEESCARVGQQIAKSVEQ
jgi:hypothetical protein